MKRNDWGLIPALSRKPVGQNPVGGKQIVVKGITMGKAAYEEVVRLWVVVTPRASENFKAIEPLVR